MRSYQFSWNQILRRLALTAGVLLVCMLARADVLELKNGKVLTGKYVGGTAGTIRFETSGGLQVIETSQALATRSEVSKIRSQVGLTFEPFMSDLNDVKKLLDSELSRESVKSAKHLTKQASWHGEDGVDSLKDVETEFDRVSAELVKYK